MPLGLTLLGQLPLMTQREDGHGILAGEPQRRLYDALGFLRINIQSARRTGQDSGHHQQPSRRRQEQYGRDPGASFAEEGKKVLP